MARGLQEITAEMSHRQVKIVAAGRIDEEDRGIANRTVPFNGEPGRRGILPAQSGGENPARFGYQRALRDVILPAPLF